MVLPPSASQLTAGLGFTVNLEGVVPTPEAQLGSNAAAPLSLQGLQTEVQGQPISREWGSGLPILGLRGSDSYPGMGRVSEATGNSTRHS